MGAEFAFHDPSMNNKDIFVAIFVVFFAAWSMAQANQFGPDMAKAGVAGKKVLNILDQPTLIDPLGKNTELDEKVMEMTPKIFRGTIEFKDVWFRYPTRKDDWVFKGLNLKINDQESIAIVGESGCGKSTLVNLIFRFYDVDHGSILVDDKDIKEYNIQELRRKFGIVSQEPTLFNYTIKENILYGNEQATNSQILKYAEAANTMEFIQSDTLIQQMDDNPATLLKLFQDNKEVLEKNLSKERYERQLKALDEEQKKQEKEGEFRIIDDILDGRDADKKDIPLMEGFNVQCGIRGNKLSGG